ncbi:MAG: glycosyltransferase [Lysobacter sp.]
MSPAGTRILQVRSSAGLYGADRVVLALNRGLNRPTAADGLVRSRLLSINNYRMQRQPVHEAALMADQPAVLLPCRGRLDHATVRALACEIRNEKADILHAHDYKSAFYAWLASRIEPVKLVATLHGQVGTSRSLRIYNRLELALLRRFDALAVVAADQIATLRAAGIPDALIHLIDNGIELPAAGTRSAVAAAALRSAVHAEAGLDVGVFVFAAVGRLAPEKNLAMLLEAFVPISAGGGVALLLIGEGPERAALEARIAQLGLGRHVHLLGERTDMARIYAAMDCLVLPSLSEGMPLVVLEAMAHGVPVLASRVGEVPRLLSHAGHARLLPPGDAGALQAGLDGMRLGSRVYDVKARDYVVAHHSLAAMTARYLELYQSLEGRVDVRQSA